jgi:hypothetical protein
MGQMLPNCLLNTLVKLVRFWPVKKIKILFRQLKMLKKQKKRLRKRPEKRLRESTPKPPRLKQKKKLLQRRASQHLINFLNKTLVMKKN